MSPRAAWRLDRLGFAAVCDYAGGKMDWLAHGRPYEGTADLVSRHLIAPDTCTLDEKVTEVRDRAALAPGETLYAVVVDDRIVVGSLRIDETDDEPSGDATVESAMRFGVSTVRPSEERAELEQRMREHETSRVIVTDPFGRLVGAFEPAPTG
jgi:Mg/Co/Ni transporter MgtE